ncbi:MAG: hypothetical protein FD145_918 [Candidatus Saganbacteria bacterium]|uniref:Ribosomal RNA small subunit methyltransferase E n=1 Tax=Candidatus Saganbacteria bacterium TaxID=2575572 RepID=A0A833L0V5_UNCSA|nr:MAG: hypothetical protein FD145_918 [Candidatus Saganbacteria bacterium]
MHRFFAPKEQISNNEIIITGSDINHIKNVLRKKVGDEVEIFDGFQNIYQARIKGLNKDEIKLGIISSSKAINNDADIKITLAQCLPKGKKMDLIVRMATELGVNSIIPVISERSIPKIGEKENKKIKHWQTIAKEACQQSGQTIIPTIQPFINLAELDPSIYDLAILPWEGEKETSLKSKLAKFKSGKLLVLIGSEGGFSQSEVDLAKKKGINTVTLGKKILRCETAAIAVLSAIQLTV